MKEKKYIYKRDNKKVLFDRNKIKDAIIQAWNQIDYPDFKKVDDIVSVIEEQVKNNMNVSEIENIVMSTLFKYIPDVARKYSSYKLKRENSRKNPNEIEKVLLNKSEVSQENANKDTTKSHIISAYLAEIPAKKAMKEALPEECLKAHYDCVVYFHDIAYSIRPMENCRLLDLDCLLQNGFELNGVWIEKPKSFRTACTVATQILTHVTGSSYGGCTINLLHLAKFVDVSRQKIKDKYKKYNIDKKIYYKICEEELNEEIKQGIQTFIYQNQTLCSII